MKDDYKRLLDIVDLSKRYCDICEHAVEFSRDDFTYAILDLLPRIYWNFLDLTGPESLEDSEYFSEYVDESLYEDVRRGISRLMGESDVFLETFEEDMKYSETPVTASISECLADIFQPLYNFICIVHDSEGDQIEEAYLSCREDFENYWSQTLCNALKALNNIKHGTIE